jgi:hypothetical protein
MQIQVTEYDSSGKPLAPFVTSWAEFARNNSDGIDAAELAEIAATLKRGEVYKLAVHCGFTDIERAPGMTFEQFQASRKPCDDIGAAISADLGGPVPTTGFLYDGGLYIETRADWWTEEAKERGAYYLILERDEYISDDLASLERKLYDWGAAYGNFD